MAIKKLSKSKRLSKKLFKRQTNRKTKTIKHNKNSQHKTSHNGGYSNSNSKKQLKHLKKNKKSNSKTSTHLKGGFMGNSSCNLATVKEAGFNLPNLAYGTSSIGGLNISDSRAVIYNPNCKTDKYQAMIP